MTAEVHATGIEQFEYPELSVAPRASERIAMEAQKELSHRWTTYIPIQLSGLMTMSAGIFNNDPNISTGEYAGIGVGLGWLALTTVLAMTYEPYHSANLEISALPKGTIREQLTRERMAEESINKIAAAGERMRWLSIASNFFTSVFILTQNKSYLLPANNNPTTRGLMDGSAFFALGAAFTPWLFRFYWSDVRDQQADFKKRIYGPVANTTLFYDAGTRSYVPGVALSFGL